MLSGIVSRARSLWRGVKRGEDLHGEMDAEFRHHMELRAADLQRAGMTPTEARRQARLEFGPTEQYKDEGRASRGLHRVDAIQVSWLDFKLGFRMLLRYPGITIVGGLALAFAIWIGAGSFEIFRQVMFPTLPLPAGDRIVGVVMWDAQTRQAERQIVHDVVAWREGVRSIRDIGAFRQLERNLGIAPGRAEPVEVAEMSATGFQVARVPALLGRTLTAEDERPGAPLVVVIGHDVWQSRFGGDPGVIGRVVRIGRAPTTIVGVMPEGFAFPISQSLWTPLRLDPLAHERRDGPGLQVFGRLADGFSLDDARAELETFGKRAAAELPETHEHLMPRVMPYAKSIFDVSEGDAEALFMAYSVNLPGILLLVLICANVALLMFARAATRESEIIVRSALGASRRRIITQLFAEALVLGAMATAVGLAGVTVGLRWVRIVVEGELMNGSRLPFWFTEQLSPTTLLYSALLTVGGAVIAGVLPAMKVTRALGSRLKETGVGAGGLRLGGVWTVVIVSQIAITLVLPILSFATQRDANRIKTADIGVPAGEFLAVRSLLMDRESLDGTITDTSAAAFQARFLMAYRELERRVAAEPGVTSVVNARYLPRSYHPHRLIDVDAGEAAPLHPQWPAYRVSNSRVGPGFFEAFEAPILLGRGFTLAEHEAAKGNPGDSGAVAGPVIVNESFVELVLGGRNPIGRRLRYRLLEEWEGPRVLRESDTWYEIVGVVRDMGMGPLTGEHDPKRAGVYHPVAPGAVYPGTMAIRMQGDPAAFAPRLRAIAMDVDPTLRLYDVAPLSRLNDGEVKFYEFWTQILLGVSAIALTLSLAGIYSVMAFTVARRTREIGIRVALGASPRRVAFAIFRKPLVQVSLGVLFGFGLATFLLIGVSGGDLSPGEALGLAVYTLFMMAVCMMACVVPTRRALRVHPTEALRSDG